MALQDLSGKFALISLETPASFIFDLFPREIQNTDRANWEPQDVTIGTKPLFYANNEPRRLQVPELWLDGSRTNEIINDQIDQLRGLKNVDAKLGRPPALLAVWGDREQLCVMEEVSITETFPFTPAGNPMRARVSLQMVELQEEHEAVSSTVREIENPIGNF